jgi:transcriptional regulator with XRE-family HTH domain
VPLQPAAATLGISRVNLFAERPDAQPRPVEFPAKLQRHKGGFPVRLTHASQIISTVTPLCQEKDFLRRNYRVTTRFVRVTPVALRIPNAPQTPLPASATHLKQLMREHGVSVNALAKAVANGERTTIQRWLRGGTIIQANREKLAHYFKVDPSLFAPPDRLAPIRPLLVEVERLRRQSGLKVGSVVAELRRLSEHS